MFIGCYFNEAQLFFFFIEFFCCFSAIHRCQCTALDSYYGLLIGCQKPVAVEKK